MKTKKALLLGIGIFAITALFAQTDKLANGELNNVKNACSLNATETAKVKPFTDQYGSDIEALKQKGIKDPAQRKQAVEQIHSNLDKNLATVLTPEQQKKWSDYEARVAAKAAAKK